jgi:hypothetical protein
MGYWVVDGQKLSNEEYEELQRQQEQDKQRAREEARRLTGQLGEAYAALKEHLRQNPTISRQITDDHALDEQIFQNLQQNLEQRLQQNLERANQAPRCSAVKEDGTSCGSPKMKNHIYCYAHCQMMEARAKKLALPPLEDANAILMSVMLVQRALIDDEISEKKAGLLLYSLQIAASTVDKTTFGQAADEDMVTETVDEDEALSTQQSAVSKNRDRNIPLTHTDNTDRARAGGQGLPRMDTDNVDQERRSGHLVIGKSGHRNTQSANSTPNWDGLG